MSALRDRCPACASASPCGCVPMPEDFRRIGFTGLFHLVAQADEETRRTWGPRVPCLIAGDRWALAGFTDEGAVLVRKDGDAIVEAFTRGGGELP